MADPAGGYTARTRVRTGQIVVAVANVAQQLPDLRILDGFALALKALRTNAGTVRVGGTKAEAEDAAVGFPLDARDFARVSASNASLLWVTSSSPLDVVAWIVEAAG